MRQFTRPCLPPYSEARSMKFLIEQVKVVQTLFLDESGDHNLAAIDPAYPVFVLGGIIADAAYAEGAMTDALNDFKRALFGDTGIVLHTADIARNRNGFESLRDAGQRARFYRNLNELMRDLEYRVFAGAILKHPYRALYGAFAPDPYLNCFATLVEKFCANVVQSENGGRIIAEGRDPVLDRQVRERWDDLTTSGTPNCPPEQISGRIQGLDLRRKADNSAGLQLADLVISPIGRHLIGKPRHDDWRIVEQKLLRNASGQYQGYGLTVLP